MDDRLIIERLEFQGYCGVSEAEREAPQLMAVDLELSLDMTDRKSTRLNSSHIQKSRMPSSA